MQTGFCLHLVSTTPWECLPLHIWRNPWIYSASSRVNIWTLVRLTHYKISQHVCSWETYFILHFCRDVWCLELHRIWNWGLGLERSPRLLASGAGGLAAPPNNLTPRSRPFPSCPCHTHMLITSHLKKPLDMQWQHPSSRVTIWTIFQGCILAPLQLKHNAPSKPQSQPTVDALLNRKPVEFPQHWSNMVTSTGAADESRCCVLDRLKAPEQTVCDPTEQRDTVVKMTTNKTLHERHCCIDGQWCCDQA